MKAAFAFVLLALSASATSSNQQYELSSPGGQWSSGSGDTFSSFTIQPFDVLLDTNGKEIDINNVGTATLPLSPFDFVDVGQLSMTVGDNQFQDDLWVFALDWGNGNLNLGIQMTGIQLSPIEVVEFRFPPLVGTPGSQVPINLQIWYFDTVPEPSTWALVAFGVGLLGVKRRMKTCV